MSSVSGISPGTGVLLSLIKTDRRLTETCTESQLQAGNSCVVFKLAEEKNGVIYCQSNIRR